MYIYNIFILRKKDVDDVLLIYEKHSSLLIELISILALLKKVSLILTLVS